MHLNSSTSQTRRHNNIHSKAQKKRPSPKTRMADRVRGPLYTWSLADRMGPTRPTLVTCTLEVPRWSASSLRHSPPHTTLATLRPEGKAAPHRRPPQEGETTKAPNHTSLNHTSDPSHGHELEPHQRQTSDQRPQPRTTRTPTPTRRRNHTNTNSPKLASCPPYIPWGSALRSSPFSAPPPFELFREASRKGAFLSSQRLIPRIHQSRASCLALPLTPNAEKKRWENPAHHWRFLFSVFLLAFSDGFRRGKGCSVVCGGWCLIAGVAAKMVRWWRTCCGDCSVVGVVAWLVVVAIVVVVIRLLLALWLFGGRSWLL